MTICWQKCLHFCTVSWHTECDSVCWSSKEGHRADALALRAEERRDKLRKAAGSGKYTEIRRSLNGETHIRRPYVPHDESIVMRGEPGELKHLSSRRKRKKKSIPKVAASEMGRAQTVMRAWRGSDCISGGAYSRTVLERPAVEGESPVREIQTKAAGSRVLRDT